MNWRSRNKREGKKVDRHLSDGKKHHYKLKYKLIVAFMIPIIIMGIATIISYRKSAQALVKVYEESTQETLLAISQSLSTQLSNFDKQVLQLVVNTSITNYNESKKDDNLYRLSYYNELKEIVDSISIANDYIAAIHICSELAPSYTTASRSLTDAYTNFKESADGKKFEEMNSKVVWTGEHPNLDALTSQMSSTYILSIMRKMTSSGYVIMDLKPTLIIDLFSKFDLGEGNIIGFITADMHEYIPDQKESIFLSNEKIKRILATVNVEEAATGSEYVEYNGEVYLFLYSTVEASGGFVCAMVPKTTITSGTGMIRTISILTFILSTVIGLVIAFLIASNISKVIVKINDTLKVVQDGDLTVQFHTKRRDEFGSLVDGISGTLHNMRTLIGNVANVDGKVNGSSKMVSENTEMLLESTKQISSAMNSIEEGVTNQAADTEQCYHHMTELSEQISELYKSTSAIDGVIKMTKGKVKDGMDAIDELEKKSTETVEITQSVQVDMKGLLNKTMAIESIVDAILDIAEQTTLLSLNASIEAARAGDAGLGFSVVAEEIRKLSNRSKEAVDNIRSIVEDIKLASNTTVLTVKEATDIVTGQHKALKESIAVFEEIENNVGDLVNHMGIITGGVSKIDQAKEETLLAITSISSVATETTAATEEVSATIMSQVEAVEEMNQLAKQLEENARLLESEIGRFHV